MSYIRGKKGSRIDIRKLAGKSLAGYAVTQGACSDGTYIYMAFERKKNHTIKIVKLVIGDHRIKIKAVSKALKIGHANDMTHRDGVLYVTHSGDSNKIHRVRASDLKKMKDVTAPAHGMNGIACLGDCYVIRAIGKPAIVVDKNFKLVRSFKWSKTYKVSQGMDSDGKTITRAFSVLQSKDKNRIGVYSTKGKLQSTKKVNVTGEMEGIFYHKGKRYGTLYRKKKKNGKMKYYAFIFTT